MYYLKLIKAFFRASIQQELAYRANAGISLLNSIITLITGFLGIYILFSRIENVHGWNFASTLVLLGVYLTLGGLRSVFIGPSLDALVGLEGEVWSGRFDFTLLRPVGVQFMASFRQWRPFALADLILGLGVLVYAFSLPGQIFTWTQAGLFLLTFGTAFIILYAILLAFASLVFWSPGFLFTWVFDAFFQMARYPVGIYPAWLRFMLTWIIPVGIMTTVPAMAITGGLTDLTVAGSVFISLLLLAGASFLFRVGLRRYESASS